MTRAKRHHFLPEFYQKNFADPMYSDNISVLLLKDVKWTNQPRTPRGTGWQKDLYAIHGTDGRPSDVYEQKFFSDLDNKCTEPMRKVATHKGCGSLTASEKHYVALFIAYLFSRNPQVLEVIRKGYVEDESDLRPFYNEDDVKNCEALRQNPDDKQATMYFAKYSLEGIKKRAEERAAEILEMRWRFSKTGPERPFITSDLPIFADRKKGVELYSCPLSSEVSVLFSTGKFKQRELFGSTGNVVAMNTQTVRRAREFIICKQRDFPGVEAIKKWAAERSAGST